MDTKKLIDWAERVEGVGVLGDGWLSLLAWRCNILMTRRCFAIFPASDCYDMSKHDGCSSLAFGGCDIRTIQELMGHKDVSTTMIYTHVLNKGGHGVKSPVDLFVAGLD